MYGWYYKEIDPCKDDETVLSLERTRSPPASALTATVLSVLLLLQVCIDARSVDTLPAMTRGLSRRSYPRQYDWHSADD